MENIFSLKNRGDGNVTNCSSGACTLLTHGAEGH